MKKFIIASKLLLENLKHLAQSFKTIAASLVHFNFNFDRRKVTFERVNNMEGEAKRNMSQCLFNNQILLTTIVQAKTTLE